MSYEEGFDSIDETVFGTVIADKRWASELDLCDERDPEQSIPAEDPYSRMISFMDSFI